MATSRALIATIVLSFLFLNIIGEMYKVEANYLAPSQSSASAPNGLDCDSECHRRCIKAKRGKTCRKCCGVCCKACNCVPPGTSGNYQSCSCYANLTNRYQIHKCP